MENLNDVREPDDITEVQDFDLDDLLREFHDIVAEEPVEVEAAIDGRAVAGVQRAGLVAFVNPAGQERR